MEALSDYSIASAPPQPGVRDVRTHLPADCRIRSTFKGLILFGVSALVYVVAIAGTAWCHQWVYKILFVSLTPIAAAALFVIGHDACHGSLTPRPLLNRILGRLSLLPSYHPFASWEHSHNGLHHGWTNVRGKDPVYVPFSKAEYDQLPRGRRALERLYRTPIGLGLLYFIEVWCKYEMFPRRSQFPSRSWATFQMDRLLVMCFIVVEALFLVAFNHAAGGQTPLGIAAILTLGLLMPLAAWNWLMGFVTFLHHTHPQVPWYRDQTEWCFFAGQVQSVVHVEFPRPIELILHNIMEHTAHHVDPKIPLYHLTRSQERLESAYGGEIVTVKWTVGGFRRTLSVCKLFDYSNHCWLDFQGRRTSPPLLTTNPTQASAAL